MRRIQWVVNLVVLGVVASVGSARVPESAFNKDPWPMPDEADSHLKQGVL